MDNAVALVQSYLYLNGYLTVTEYPVLQIAGGRPRMATDIDLLALRLPSAGGLMTAGPRPPEAGDEQFLPDEDLAAPRDRADFLIGEVKEGRAVLNRGATDSDVLSAVLSRFVQHVADDLPGTVEELRCSGRSILGEHVQARLVAFGVADAVEDRGGYRVIPPLPSPGARPTAPGREVGRAPTRADPGSRRRVPCDPGKARSEQ